MGYSVRPTGAPAAVDTEVIVAVLPVGRLPRLALDRTGIALLATGASSLERAADAVDAPP